MDFWGGLPLELETGADRKHMSIMGPDINRPVHADGRARGEGMAGLQTVLPPWLSVGCHGVEVAIR